MSMIIHDYGRFWNPLVVDWRSKTLKGYVRRKKNEGARDFWKANGVYVLHKDFELVYVGRTTNQPIGDRLKYHLIDNLAGRWNSFSWFSVSTPTSDGVRATTGIKHNVSPAEAATTLEALAIMIARPQLNRAEVKFPGKAQEIVQLIPDTKKTLLKMSELDERDLLGNIHEAVLQLSSASEKPRAPKARSQKKSKVKKHAGGSLRRSKRNRKRG